MAYIQDIFLFYYDFRPSKYIFLNKIIGNFTKIFGVLANIILPLVFRYSRYSSHVEKSHDNQEFIVSLTSFPARINKVWLVIECLLRQTLRPRKIVLYLSKQQFHNMEEIPHSLQKYIQNVLEIRFVEGDIRSHKKYWYALSDFPGRDIITIDDDLIYDSHMIESLVVAHKKNPIAIPCRWGTQIKYDSISNDISPYSEWKGSMNLELWKINPLIFYGSGGGTYFPYNSLKGADVKWSVLKEICPTADDIWLNAVTRKNGFYPIKVSNNRMIPGWIIWRDVKLSTENNGLKKNNIQLQAVCTWFLREYGLDPFSPQYAKYN